MYWLPTGSTCRSQGQQSSRWAFNCDTMATMNGTPRNGISRSRGTANGRRYVNLGKGKPVQSSGTKAGTNGTKRGEEEGYNDHVEDFVRKAHIIAIIMFGGASLVGIWGASMGPMTKFYSTFGIVLASMGIWHCVKSWLHHQLTGNALFWSIVLYSICQADEILGAIAKFKGGAFQQLIYEGVLPVSVALILAVGIITFMTLPKSRAAREELGLEVEEQKESRRLKNEERWDRIEQKRNKLFNSKLARLQNRALNEKWWVKVMNELSSWGTSRRLKKLAKEEVKGVITIVVEGNVENIKNKVKSLQSKGKVSDAKVISESSGIRKKRKLPGRPSEFCPGVAGEECGEPISKRQSRCRKCKRRATYLRSKGEEV